MNVNSRLSQITTSWTVVCGAVSAQHPAAQQARRQLLETYSSSIRRYLLASLKDQTAADEVYQNFALKLVRGDFSVADPTRGRFRSFVKTVLYRLMVDYHRSELKNNRWERIATDPTDKYQQAPDQVADEELRQYWREGLLEHAWMLLEKDQKSRGGISYTLLRLRANHPNVTQQELLDEIERTTGSRPKPGSLRVALHRARQRFADYLVEAVACTLGDRSEQHLEDELVALDLQKYCTAAIGRRESNRPVAC